MSVLQILYSLRCISIFIADGQVVTIDTRLTPAIGEQKFKCFNGKIVSLSHHPLNENLIMASSVNGFETYYVFSSNCKILLIFWL